MESAPAPAEVLAEARGRRPARLVAVEDAVDLLGARQKPEALGGQVRAAGAAGRQPPAHGGEVVEDALAEERLALSGRPLVALAIAAIGPGFRYPCGTSPSTAGLLPDPPTSPVLHRLLDAGFHLGGATSSHSS